MAFYTVPDYPSLPGLMFPIIRTPEWDTDVQVALSGRRTAFARRAYPRYRYELSYSFLRTASPQLEFQTLMAFYSGRNGRANLFVYTDQDDNTVTVAQSFGTGDGTTTQFQLVRTMTGIGAYTFIEPVFAVQTASIFDNGVLQSTPANYSIGASGIVTFVAAPIAGHLLTWTGTYGWYARFDDDVNQFEKFVYNLYEIRKVKFSTETF